MAIDKNKIVNKIKVTDKSTFEIVPNKITDSSSTYSAMVATLTNDAELAITTGTYDSLTSGDSKKLEGSTKQAIIAEARKGLASLDPNGKVPSEILPSYVDDVLEGYLFKGNFYLVEQHTEDSKVIPEAGKIYVALDTNKTYRWSGSTYVEISESLALGETPTTAYAGSKGKLLADKLVDLEKAQAGKQDAITCTEIILTPAEEEVLNKISGGKEGRYTISEDTSRLGFFTTDKVSIVHKEATGEKFIAAVLDKYTEMLNADIGDGTKKDVCYYKDSSFVIAPMEHSSGACVMQYHYTPGLLEMFVYTGQAVIGEDIAKSTASISNTTGTPDVTVTKNDAGGFNFAFSNLKGETGQPGAQGGPGDQGPRGYSIGSISKKSGSTASGQTAVYSVKQETTGTELGTFEVYNGTNGLSPHVGANGNWFVGNSDTGTKAQGPGGLTTTDATTLQGSSKEEIITAATSKIPTFEWDGTTLTIRENNLN